MTIIQSIVLGLVQGLTEFLPVSSSGHLALLSTIFGIYDSDLFFSVMVHVATLIAVVIVLRRDIADLFRHPKTLLYLVVATIPAVIAALVFDVDAVFTADFLGFAFILTGIILTVGEAVSARYTQKKGEVGWLAAIVMGVMQAIAIIPGVSRSGSTITGGLVTGTERKSVARFAFLMSIPAILGGFVLECVDLIKYPAATANIQWLPVILGMVAAFVSGFLAIRFMLALIAKRRLWGFAIYTLALGCFVLLDQFIFHIFFAAPF